MPNGLVSWINGLGALFAVTAATLWIASARVAVVDQQSEPRPHNLVVRKKGHRFDASGTAQTQSRLSAYASFAAALAALLQAFSLMLSP